MDQRANSVLTARERQNAAIAPYRYPKGRSGNLKGRPKRVDLAACIDAYMRGQPDTVTDFPSPVMDLIDAVAKASRKDAGMLKELLLRWQGYPQKALPPELPATTVVVQAVRVPVLPKASGSDSTSLPGSPAGESRIETPVRAKPRLMPIIGESEVVRLPPRDGTDG